MEDLIKESMYWSAQLSALVWAVLYFRLRMKLKQQFIARGKRMDYYADKSIKANKQKRIAYLYAIRVLTIEQENYPRTYTERALSWLTDLLKSRS